LAVKAKVMDPQKDSSEGFQNEKQSDGVRLCGRVAQITPMIERCGEWCVYPQQDDGTT
jgi:hypothetical protein